jgi:hypothetical protein
MNRSHYSNTTTFLDLLFNMLLAFVALFVLSFAMIAVEKKNEKTEDVKAKAEFIITATWPNDLDDDYDLWVSDPDGNIVFYSRREEGLMHLERDDTGMVNDYIMTSEGIVKFHDNVETVSIRGIIPGEYIVNIHAYRKKSGPPIPVTVKIDKINPMSTVVLKTIQVSTQGQETTISRFTINAAGKVQGVTDLPKSLLETAEEGAPR